MFSPKLPPVLAAALLALCIVAKSPCAHAAGSEPIADLKIGDPAPPFSLPGIDGKTHTLADYTSAKVLAIVFISNHCPDSHAAEARLLDLLKQNKEKGFAMVAINPNNPDGLTIDELGYSKYDDSFADMQKYAKEKGFTFPYLYDGETQSVARAYGCLATPHLFVFDAERKLRYRGFLDDSRYANPATVKSAEGKIAVEALLAGQPVSVPITKPHGCSTKWMTKKSAVAEHMEKWDRTPVEVAPLDVKGAATLRKNGSQKLRLINVWSTTCAPCVAEFPELVKTARKFDHRDFEFISISTDEAGDSAKVKEFLEKRGAGPSDRLQKSLKEEGRATNAYQFTGADLNELAEALDPQWPGGMPYTILVGPKGDILWRHPGPVDGDELRGKILDLLGPYYTP